MAEANALIRIQHFPPPVKPCPFKARERGRPRHMETSRTSRPSLRLRITRSRQPAAPAAIRTRRARLREILPASPGQGSRPAADPRGSAVGQFDSRFEILIPHCKLTHYHAFSLFSSFRSDKIFHSGVSYLRMAGDGLACTSNASKGGRAGGIDL